MIATFFRLMAEKVRMFYWQIGTERDCIKNVKNCYAHPLTQELDEFYKKNKNALKFSKIQIEYIHDCVHLSYCTRYNINKDNFAALHNFISILDNANNSNTNYLDELKKLRESNNPYSHPF